MHSREAHLTGALGHGRFDAGAKMTDKRNGPSGPSLAAVQLGNYASAFCHAENSNPDYHSLSRNVKDFSGSRKSRMQRGRDESNPPCRNRLDAEDPARMLELPDCLLRERIALNNNRRRKLRDIERYAGTAPAIGRAETEGPTKSARARARASFKETSTEQRFPIEVAATSGRERRELYLNDFGSSSPYSGRPPCASNPKPRVRFFYFFLPFFSFRRQFPCGGLSLSLPLPSPCPSLGLWVVPSGCCLFPGGIRYAPSSPAQSGRSIVVS